MADKFLTQAEIAREFSVDKALVSRNVKSGNLKPKKFTDTGKPLFSYEDAKKLFANSFLNNRKINHIKSDSKTDKKDEPKSLKSIPKESTKKVDKKLTVNELVNELTESSTLDEWFQELLGPDYDFLDDASKIARSRAVREMRLAALEDLNVRKQKGLLIEKEVLDFELKTIGAEMTSILHNFPSRLSPDLSVMNDQHEIKQYLIDEVNQLIDRMKAKLEELDKEQED